MYLFKHAKKVKNGFHEVVKKCKNVVKHHGYYQHRSRLAFDMNINHYLSSAPHQCIYPHSKHQTKIDKKLLYISPKGYWDKKINPKTNKEEDWFIYAPITEQSPTLTKAHKKSADSEVPILVHQSWIHSNAVHLYDAIFEQIQDIHQLIQEKYILFNYQQILMQK